MRKQIFILLSALFISSSFLGCDDEYPVQYTYIVDGTALDYNVTIQNADKKVEHFPSVVCGWNYKWFQTGTRWLSISAQNNTTEGSVSVHIYKGEVEVATQTSSDSAAIVTVSGVY